MQNQIPNNWQKVKLGDISTLITKGTTPTTIGGKFTDNGINFIKIESITEDGKFLHDKFDHIDQETNLLLRRSILSNNDILYSIAGAIGRVALVTKKELPANINQALAIIRPNTNKINPEYLFYILSTPYQKRFANNVVAQSVQSNINLQQVGGFEIELPSLVEQIKIASTLSTFDGKIEVNNKIAKTLGEMAQALFKEWFVAGASSEWKRSKFENYVRLEYGKALQEGKRIFGEVLVFGSSGQVGAHNEKLCNGPGIVVGRKGNVGSVFWVDEDFYPIDTTFYIKSKISLYYIYFILKNMRFHTGDSAVPGLNRESVHSIEILIPDNNMLDKFEEIVSPMFKKLAEIKKENQKLAAIRDLLLPKLMRGEISL